MHKQTVFIGSLNASIVHPREVFKEALRRSAASLICVHNHPSGDPTPSREDIEVTRRLVECGQMLGIEVLDHLIIGEKKYVSLKEKGYL
jgi:DNA repair protein RadC